MRNKLCYSSVEPTRLFASELMSLIILHNFYFMFHRSPNGKYFALKQIEGTGISMSACREIAVSLGNYHAHL